MFTICPNRTGCPGQASQHVKHFVSKGAMDIDGLGEKQVALNLLDRGLIADVADIYDLTEERLVEDRKKSFNETSARNLVAAIDASRAQPFKRVLYALGLPGVGAVTAEALADHFGSIDALREADPEAIEEVEGVGPIMAVQIAESLGRRAHLGAGREAAREGPAARGRRVRTARRRRPAGRQDGRPHRHPARADPRGGGGAGRSRPAAR